VPQIWQEMSEQTWESAKNSVLKPRKKEGIIPQTRHVNLLILNAARRGDLETAIRAFKK